MPEPLTIRWDESMGCYRVSEPDFASNGPERVYREGDMQAALDEIERLKAADEGIAADRDEARSAVRALRVERDRAVETRENANAVSVRVELENEQLKRRAAVVAEALRDLSSAISAHLYESEAPPRLENALAVANQLIEGVEHSHELVALGTQQALVDLVEVAETLTRHYTTLSVTGLAPFTASITAAKALVEGVELARPRESEAVDVIAEFLHSAGPPLAADDCAEAIVSALAGAGLIVRSVEGVERTPTPEPLVPGAAARADALACPGCGGLPAGEASGAGDLCTCPWEQVPSAGGITDEMVRVGARAFAEGFSHPHHPCQTEPCGECLDDARRVLAATLELQAGSGEGHTLVPNGELELLAEAAQSEARRGEGKTAERWQARADAAREAARGGRPQWPGTGGPDDGA
jgi:bacterioferritin-associated ferredoxin